MRPKREILRGEVLNQLIHSSLSLSLSSFSSLTILTNCPRSFFHWFRMNFFSFQNRRKFTRTRKGRLRKRRKTLISKRFIMDEKEYSVQPRILPLPMAFQRELDLVPSRHPMSSVKIKDQLIRSSSLPSPLYLLLQSSMLPLFSSSLLFYNHNNKQMSTIDWMRVRSITEWKHTWDDQGRKYLSSFLLDLRIILRYPYRQRRIESLPYCNTLLPPFSPLFHSLTLPPFHTDRNHSPSQEDGSHQGRTWDN